MAVRGGWRPLSGLICEIVNSVGQGNFTFVREKSGKSQGISNTYGCGNHVNYTVQISFMGAIIIVEIVHRKPLPDTYNLELVTLYLYM